MKKNLFIIFCLSAFIKVNAQFNLDGTWVSQTIAGDSLFISNQGTSYVLISTSLAIQDEGALSLTFPSATQIDFKVNSATSGHCFGPNTNTFALGFNAPTADFSAIPSNGNNTLLFYYTAQDSCTLRYRILQDRPFNKVQPVSAISELESNLINIMGANIIINNPSIVNSVTLFNVLGQKIYTSNIINEQINLTSFNRGHYIALIVLKNGTYQTKKIIL